MTRAYLRLDPAFDERKDHYPDGAYRLLIACLCMAETQVNRGRFRSLDYLKRLSGKRSRWLKYLLDEGDLVVLDDGRVYVDGWDEWQEGDVTVRERMQRLRQRRKRNAGYGDGYGSPLSSRESKTDSGGGAEQKRRAVAADSASAMSDDERRGRLDELRASMEQSGVEFPGSPNGSARPAGPSETDEQLVERCNAILGDQEAPQWKRDAAKAQLEAMAR